MLNRWLKLWSPINAKVSLSGVRWPSGAIASTPDDKAKALSDHWSKVFSDKNICKKEANEFLSKFQDDFYSDVLNDRISPGEIKEALQVLVDSGVGPDGYPYSAWKAGGEEACITLSLVAEEMCKTGTAPKDFNESLTVLPPKGSNPEDKVKVIRAPEDTRPLSLKTSDNKTITSVVNNRLAGVCTLANASQRGFVRGRQGFLNITDVDTCARILDMLHSAGLLWPIIVLFDFAAAFPSISHTYLHKSLKFVNIPPNFLKVFQSSIYK